MEWGSKAPTDIASDSRNACSCLELHSFLKATSACFLLRPIAIAGLIVPCSFNLQLATICDEFEHAAHLTGVVAAAEPVLL
jgi:hypothetical protein